MARDSDSLALRPVPEALARSLRHEVGDLLQTIYAAVALLQRRLPPGFDLEQRLLADLRSRAETCRNQLDATHDLFCPMTLSREPVDLAELTSQLAAEARELYPQLHVETEAASAPRVQGDRNRLTLLGRNLLTNACQWAEKRVRIRAASGPGAGEVEWTVTDDGPGAAAEHLDLLFAPFFTTRPGRLGLGLSMARKLAELHGGRVTAGNAPGGGFRAQVVLPVTPSDHSETRARER